jgi:transcriptional regulator with XRE-family HTH domain
MPLITSDIKAWRKRHGMTQYDLAGHLRVDQAAVSHWEKGKAFPSGPACVLLELWMGLDAKPGTLRVATSRNTWYDFLEVSPV